jgi:hypothetical protein
MGGAGGQLPAAGDVEKRAVMETTDEGKGQAGGGRPWARPGRQPRR